MITTPDIAGLGGCNYRPKFHGGHDKTFRDKQGEK